MGISAAKEAERQKIWAYARHSLWLKGSPDAKDVALFERYIRGDITRPELNAAVQARAGETPSDAPS